MSHSLNQAEQYNLALDCVDKHAGSLLNKHKTALVYLKADASLDRLREPPLRLSFSSLAGLSNAMANALRALGLSPGTRVVLRLPNSPQFPISFLGAVKAGLIPIPTSPHLTWRELQFVLEDSESQALISSQDLLPRELLLEAPPSLRRALLLCEQDFFQTLHASHFTLHRWQNLLKASAARFTTEATPAESPAFWLYTSGTAGHPKAVIHAHRSIRAHDARAKYWQDFRSGDVVFNTSALNWSYALTCGLLDVWRHGLTSLVYQGELTAERIAQIVSRHGVTTFMSVPGIYRRLLPYLRQHKETFRGVRVCLSAGEQLHDETREEFRKLTGLEIYEGLGMTEHSVYLVQRYGEPIVKDSCGKPLPGQRIAVLREDLCEAEAGEVGILASHRGCKGLMLGYFNRPEEEAEAWQGEWFLSGDLASRDQAGNFFFLGRRDDVLTSGGYRISPAEVEAALNQHSAVEESAVVDLALEPGKNILQGFVVLKAGFPATQATAQEILAQAADRLAKYKLPRQLVFLRELPKTSNGKLKRQALGFH